MKRKTSGKQEELPERSYLPLRRIIGRKCAASKGALAICTKLGTKSTNLVQQFNLFHSDGPSVGIRIVD